MAKKTTKTKKTTYNPEDYPIDETCPIQRIVRPGEYLYIPCHGGGRNGIFYVKALINEVSYVHFKEGMKGSVWPSLYLDGFEYAQENHPEVMEKLPGTKIFNQFPWVDWPIGHAAYIGSDGFFTLEEARKACGRGRKKGKYRRARQYLSSVMGFVYKTHKMATLPGEPTPPWPWPSRKSFYRRVYT